jgi:signal transduction histidine kinase
MTVQIKSSLESKRASEIEAFQKKKSQNADQILLRKEILLDQLRNRITKFRKEVMETNDVTIKNRTRNNNRILESLKKTNERVRAQHQAVKDRLNKVTVQREVNLRVSRGLESLEDLVTTLRIASMSDRAIKEALRDPALSGTPNEKFRKESLSEFVKSVQRQLVEQTDFINIAAHELRTPIMPILVNAEILQEDLGDKREEIRVIARNALRLQHLAQNILDASRIDSKTLPLKMEVFSLSQLIREVLQDMSTLLDDRARLLSRLEEEIDVYGDKVRIGQVLTNVLGNAIKLTKVGLIEVSAAKQDHQAVVTVRDSGPGIDPELMPLLFSRFGKKSRSGSGMGLGLYISKGIIDAHSGTISASNNTERQGGATFRFTIPLASEKSQSQETSVK